MDRLLHSAKFLTMRAVQEAALSEMVYVQRLVSESDGMGGWTETWQTAAVVRGRIAPYLGEPGEEVRGGALRAYGENVVSLPQNTELLQNDRVQISGVQYDVRAKLERSQKTALRVIVSKV